METQILSSFLQSEAYFQKRREIMREINSYPIFIDRSVFKKTPAEKIALANAKSSYKNRYQP